MKEELEIEYRERASSRKMRSILGYFQNTSTYRYMFMTKEALLDEFARLVIKTEGYQTEEDRIDTANDMEKIVFFLFAKDIFRVEQFHSVIERIYQNIKTITIEDTKKTPTESFIRRAKISFGCAQLLRQIPVRYAEDVLQVDFIRCENGNIRSTGAKMWGEFYSERKRLLGVS